MLDLTVINVQALLREHKLLKKLVAKWHKMESLTDIDQDCKPRITTPETVASIQQITSSQKKFVSKLYHQAV